MVESVGIVSSHLHLNLDVELEVKDIKDVGDK